MNKKRFYAVIAVIGVVAMLAVTLLSAFASIR